MVSKALRKVDQETRKEVKDKRLQMLEADNYNIESTTNEVDEADFSEEVFVFVFLFFLIILFCL